MNNVTLTGRLTHEPNLVHRNDRAICEMRIAGDNPGHEPTFIDVRVFDGQAYACAEFLAKGRLIGVSGRLVYNEWRNGEGKRRERYSVIGRVEFLDRPPRQTEPELPLADRDDTGAEAKVEELLAA
jgi:single-strand DNA-binding protein